MCQGCVDDEYARIAHPTQRSVERNPSNYIFSKSFRSEDYSSNEINY